MTTSAAQRWRRLRLLAVLGTTVLALLTTLPAAAAQAASTCDAGSSAHQAKVERFLGLVADGRNSRSDCRAIRGFQRANGIEPGHGYAGGKTSALVTRLRRAVGRADHCDRHATVVCVDLTSQTIWIAKRGVTTWGPFAIRSGRNGYETRTGSFHVQSKDLNHVSSIFGSAMPFAMFFSGGQAFHTSDRYLYDTLGSHGCVHILPTVAQALWNQVGVGTAVEIFGSKPGT